MEIKNIAVAEFCLLSEDEKALWNIYFQSNEFRTPFDHLGIGDIYEKTFGLIKDTQQKDTEYTVSDMVITLEKFSGKIKEHIFESVGIFEAYRTFEYIKQELIKLTENERELLSEQPDGKMLASGISEFEQFGVYLQYRKLSGGDVTKLAAIEKMDYATCFAELLYQKVLNDFNMRYAKNAK